MRRKNALNRSSAVRSRNGAAGLAALSGITLSEVLEPLLRLLQVIGVSRSEVLAVVRKLPVVKLPSPVTVVRGRLEYWSQAVIRWAADPRFLGADGRPRDLAFVAGDPSFSDLVRLALPRERPALCRDILLATGAIIRLPSGQLRWRERAALAKGADSGVVLADEYLRPLRALLLALETNLLHRTNGAGDFPDPPLQCPGRGDLWQISTRLTRDPLKTLFLVQWNQPYEFEMLQVSQESQSLCP